MRAPDYDWGDLVWAIGALIIGGSVYYFLPYLGVTHHAIRLVVAALIGGPAGYMLEKAFRER